MEKIYWLLILAAAICSSTWLHAQEDTYTLRTQTREAIADLDRASKEEVLAFSMQLEYDLDDRIADAIQHLTPEQRIRVWAYIAERQGAMCTERSDTMQGTAEYTDACEN